MNEITTIDVTAIASTALTVIPASLVSTILQADENDILGKLAAKVAAHKPDISTPKGRDEIRSLAAEIASSKVTLIKLGKTLTEGWRKSTKAVNEECNIIEEKMDALKIQVRQPLTDFENTEKMRVAAHEAALATMQELASATDANSASGLVLVRIDRLGEIYKRDWQLDFGARADRTYTECRAKLLAQYERSLKLEAEAAELARLRAEEAERQRLAAIEAQRIREEQIARDAAERAQREAEAKAARDADEARKAAQRAQEEAERKAQAERDAAARREHDAAEALARAEREKLAILAKAEADRIAAIERERIAAERAEINRQAEITRAERDKVEAIAAERQRVAAQRAADLAESERRERNVAHRRHINGEILADMLKAIEASPEITLDDGVDIATPFAKAIIAALAKGQIRHATVQY